MPAHSLLHGAVLRLGVFVFLALVGLNVFASLLITLGLLVAATLSVFLTGLVSNLLSVRIYENGRIADVGMAAERPAGRNLVLGLLGGVGAALLVAGLPLLAGWAELVPTPLAPASASGLLFVSGLLAFGAVGEELLFRGYAFNVLRRLVGPTTAIALSSLLFGLAHSSNVNATLFGLTNTVLWGVLFGIAAVRSNGLWLPIGLHYGWNATLPLFGVSLSGFTMGTTGHAIHWRVGEFWSGGAYGPEGGALTSAVLPVLLVYLYKAPVGRQATPALPSLEN